MVDDAEHACAGIYCGGKLEDGAVDDDVAPSFDRRFPPCEASLFLLVLLPL